MDDVLMSLCIYFQAALPPPPIPQRNRTPDGWHLLNDGMRMQNILHDTCAYFFLLRSYYNHEIGKAIAPLMAASCWWFMVHGIWWHRGIVGECLFQTWSDGFLFSMLWTYRFGAHLIWTHQTLNIITSTAYTKVWLITLYSRMTDHLTRLHSIRTL